MSRHAKNKARLYKIALDDVVKLVEATEPVATDDDGNPIYASENFVVVVALDDPEVVITIWET